MKSKPQSCAFPISHSGRLVAVHFFSGFGNICDQDRKWSKQKSKYQQQGRTSWETNQSSNSDHKNTFSKISDKISVPKERKDTWRPTPCLQPTEKRAVEQIKDTYAWKLTTEKREMMEAGGLGSIQPWQVGNLAENFLLIWNFFYTFGENIATGETSPAITPYHTYHFSISTSLTFINSKLPSQDDFNHLITFTTR